jgi:hypothetical protein
LFRNFVPLREIYRVSLCELTLKTIMGETVSGRVSLHSIQFNTTHKTGNCMHDLFQALSSGSIRVFQERRPVEVQDVKKGEIIVSVM